MANEQISIYELSMDQANLFREETVTDRQVGTIRI